MNKVKSLSELSEIFELVNEEDSNDSEEDAIYIEELNYNK